MLAEAQWLDGESTAGHQAKRAKNNLQLAQSCPVGQTLGRFIVARLNQHECFKSAALPCKVFPPMFNCYQAGGSFGNHIDNAIRYPEDGSQCVRTDLSITVFLSDPESYQGGELRIEDTYGQQSIKLAAGDAILYPSTSMHRVEPVTAGKRMASFFWIQSLIRSDEQRRVLYDLDQSIQSLTQQNPEQVELVKLTGVYHNLLRQWSDT